MVMEGRKKYIYALLCAMVLFMSLTAAETCRAAIGVGVVPSLSQVDPGGTFYVDITAEAISTAGLGAIQFRLMWSQVARP